MTKFMYNSNDGGFHNFTDDEVETARKTGWVDGEPIRQMFLDAKRTVAKPAETVTIQAPQEEKRLPGRPRKEVPSHKR